MCMIVHGIFKNWQEQLRIYTDRIPWPYNRPTKHKCHILRVHSDKLNALSTGLNFHYYCLQPLIYLPLPSSAGRSDSRVGWKWYWVREDLWCFVLKSAYISTAIRHLLVSFGDSVISRDLLNLVNQQWRYKASNKFSQRSWTKCISWKWARKKCPYERTRLFFSRYLNTRGGYSLQWTIRGGSGYIFQASGI